MAFESVCLLCLSTNAPMRNIANCPLQEIYEKLTNISSEERPVTACYRCYSQLKKCHALTMKAVTVYKLLSQMQKSGMVENGDSIAMIDRKAYKLNDHLSITYTEHFDIAPRKYISKMEIKGEPGQDVVLKTEALLNIEDIKREVSDDIEDIDNNKLTPERDVNTVTSSEVSNNVENIDNDRLTHETDVDTVTSKQIDVQKSDESTGEKNVDQNYPIHEVSECVEEVERKRLLNKKFNIYDILDIKREVPETIVENDGLTEEKDVCEALDHTEYNEYDALIDIKDIQMEYTNGAAPALQCKQTHAEKQNNVLTTDYENMLNKPRCKQVTEGKECAEKIKLSELISKYSIKKSYIDMNNINCTPSTALNVNNKTYLRTNFICDHCGIKFKIKCLLIKHMELHKIKKVVTSDTRQKYECNVCQKLFIKNGFLIRHLKLHAEKNKIVTSEYTGHALLRDKTKATINRPVLKKMSRCHDIANKNHFDLESKDENNTDVNVNIENKYLQTKFICDYCGVIFDSKHLLRKHIKNHRYGKFNNEIERPYGCTVCKKRFTKKRYLTQHFKTHTIKISKSDILKKTITCTVCQRDFKTETYLKVHFRTHTEEKPYQCTVCERRFIQASHLYKHKRIHTGERPFECSICFQKFRYKYDMHLHFVRHTDTGSSTDTFECPTCARRFSEKKNLTLHIKRHDKYEIECDICQRRFKKSYLKTHLTSHTGEKPFECTICHNRFNRKDSLNTHLRNHNGDKPFKCDICDRKFSLKKVFLKHLKRHSGVRPFECDACHGKFTTKYSLGVHLKKMHAL